MKTGHSTHAKLFDYTHILYIHGLEPNVCVPIVCVCVPTVPKVCVCAKCGWHRLHCDAHVSGQTERRSRRNSTTEHYFWPEGFREYDVIKYIFQLGPKLPLSLLISKSNNNNTKGEIWRHIMGRGRRAVELSLLSVSLPLRHSLSLREKRTI